jgi:hypothetical protein
MNEVTQKQKEMYKNHLEFLGYKIEDDPDDEQEITIIQNGVRTFARIFQSGIRVLLIYGISDNAKKDWLPFLEFVNECNDKRIAKVSVNEWSSFVIEMYYFRTYEKVSFGEFMKLFDDERQRIVKDSLEKDFLA